MKHTPFRFAGLMALAALLWGSAVHGQTIYNIGPSSPFGNYGPYVTRPFSFSPGSYYYSGSGLYGIGASTYPRTLYLPGSYASLYYDYYAPGSYRYPYELYGPLVPSSTYLSTTNPYYLYHGVATLPPKSTYSYYPQSPTGNDSKTNQPLTSSVQVKVPNAEAEVWFGNTKTKQTGLVREFSTPPLEPGQKYNYQIRATWMEQGIENDYNRKVTFVAGENVVIDFTQKGITTQPQELKQTEESKEKK